jgi:transposase-like protein
MSAQKNVDGGKPRNVYSEEFKRSVVDHWCSSDKTAVQVAQDFGVKVWNVRDWRRRYGPGPQPPDAPLPATPEAMGRELQLTRKELARMRLQRDI